MEHTRSSCSLQRCQIAPREERSQLAIPREGELPSCFEQEVEECESTELKETHDEQEQR